MGRGEFTLVSVMGIQADVEAFMGEFGQEIPDKPTIPPYKVLELRHDLIREEWEEEDELESSLLELMWMAQEGEGVYTEGQIVRALAALADGIADLIYVAVGTASACGIDLAPIWEEVQRTNMAKAGGPVLPNGKRGKPEGWKPPNLERIIREQMA